MADQSKHEKTKKIIEDPREQETPPNMLLYCIIRFYNIVTATFTKHLVSVMTSELHMPYHSTIFDLSLDIYLSISEPF